MKQKNRSKCGAYEGLNMSLEEVAIIEGVSKARIQQIEQKALNKIRKYLLNRFGSSVTMEDILPILNKESNHVPL